MKKVRTVKLKENTKLPIVIIIIAFVMALLSVLSIEITYNGLSVGFGSLASVISVLPLTVAVSTFMLIKTKKATFGEFPCYVISILIVLAFLLILVFKLASGFEFFAIMLCVLMVYPYIVAGLTVRGAMYNKMISIGFSSLLLLLSIIAVIAASVLLQGFSLTFLLLPLMYTELILEVMCFELMPIKRKPESYEGIL